MVGLAGLEVAQERVHVELVGGQHVGQRRGDRTGGDAVPDRYVGDELAHLGRPPEPVRAVGAELDVDLEPVRDRVVVVEVEQLPGEPHLAPGIGPVRQVAAVDDEAVGDGPGGRQLVRERARAIAVAEEDRGADGAHAPHE